MAVRYGSLPFIEAITFFKGKLNVPTERWNDVWQAGHNNAFMVAGAMKDDLLNDFRKAVDMAIAEGKSLTWFKKEFKNIVARHGWEHTGKAAWRSKVIYDTNIRQSYNAGRFEQLQHFEFWEYRHGDSLSPRPMHLSWNGLLLAKDDAWWLTHMPQNGWGCKCKVYGRSQATMERKGLTPGTAPKDGSFDWTDKATGEVHVIPKGIDPGFDYAPQKPIQKRQLQQQAKTKAKAKAKVYQPPKRVVPTVFSTVKGADVHGLNRVLDEMKQTRSKVQVEQLGQFLKSQNVKSLFLKVSEMGPGTRATLAIEPQVEEYLQTGFKFPRVYFTTRHYRKSWGFTSSSYDHVNIRVGSTVNFSKANSNELRQSVVLAKLLGDGGQEIFSMSHLIRTLSESGHHGGTIVTWLHEIGHQLHFKAGSPKRGVEMFLTTRARADDFEWHAEHFAAWVLNRKALAEFSPELAEYFDKLMEQVLNG